MSILAKKVFSRTGFSLTAAAVSAGIFAFLAGHVIRSADVRTSIASEINQRINERVAGQGSVVLFALRSADMERIRNSFITRSQPIAFVENLKETAQAVGNTVSLTVDEGRSGAHDLLFQITVDGSQENVARYLALLEELPYVMHVEEIIFEKTVPGTNGPDPKSRGARAAVSIRAEAL